MRTTRYTWFLLGVLKLLLALSASGKGFLYFTQPGCPPCARMQPELEALRAAGHGVVVYDITTAFDRPFATRYNVTRTPTTILIGDRGEAVKRWIGYTPAATLQASVPQAWAGSIDCGADEFFTVGGQRATANRLAPWSDKASGIVRVVSSNGTQLMVGSGGYLGDGWVLTAKHNLTDARETKIQASDGRWHSVTQVEFAADDTDLALIKTCVLNVTAYTVADADPGGELQVTYGGFAHDQPLRVWRTSRSTKRDFDGYNEFHGQTYQGVSGGPVVANGTLYGVVTNTSGDPRDQFMLAVKVGPIRRLVRRVLGKPANKPVIAVPQQPAREPTPAAAPSTSCEQCEANAAAIAALRGNVDDLAGRQYVEQEEIEGVVRQPELAAADQGLRDHAMEVAQAAKDGAITAAKEAIRDKVSDRVGLFEGMSYGKLLAGALGVSGPIGLGIIVAGGLIGRRAKRRLADRGAEVRESVPFRSAA